MKVMMKRMAILLAVFILALSLLACTGKVSAGTEQVELVLDHEEELQYATRFTLTRYEGGYSAFTIPGIDDRKFLIVPEGKKVPDSFSENTVILQQPVNRICYSSGSLASLAEALGAMDSFATVSIEKENWALESVIRGMEDGSIRFSGSYKTPDFEILLDEGVQLDIDTSMLVSHPDIQKKYEELGIPYLIEDSSKEQHPLGRLEWIKLLGAILGKDEEAAAYFEAQVEKVRAVEGMEGRGKTAALFYIGERATYVRNAGDYTTAMLNLAGGRSITAGLGIGQGGNTKMDFEEFYVQCKDADYLFWIIMSCPCETIDELIEYNSVFADFKAVQNGNVYTSKPGFAQRTADIVDVILEWNQIFSDPSIEETETFVKLR